MCDDLLVSTGVLVLQGVSFNEIIIRKPKHFDKKNNFTLLQYVMHSKS